MSNIELVIKIPEGVMEYIKNNGCLAVGYLDEVAKAIKNGTPLPKGHDRLIDMKRLRKFVSDYNEYDAVQLILADRKDYLPTIIEADKESEE